MATGQRIEQRAGGFLENSYSIEMGVFNFG